jgi:hypothetical protein
MMDEQAWRLDELREEARYRRERLELTGRGCTPGVPAANTD